MANAVTTTSNQLPEFLQSRLYNNIARAENIASRPYQAYGGPRVAGFNADDTNRFNMTRDTVGSFKPYATEAGDLYKKTGQLFNNDDFSNFKNSYVDNIVDQIAKKGNRNLTENILPQVNDTFTGAGQFGSRRNYDFTNRAIRDTQEGISDAQGKALFESQDAAMKAYQDALGRLNTTASGVRDLGTAAKTAEGVDLSRLAGIGQEQRDMTQRNYDVAYGDFKEQRDFPKENVNWMSGIINGAPNQNTSTSTSQTQSPSTLQSILQLGAIGAGAYFRKDGGSIKKKKKAVRRKRS